MTRQEALERLQGKGIEGPDAETALDRLTGFEQRLQDVLEMSVDLTEQGVLHLFGSDNGRAVLALRAE